MRSSRILACTALLLGAIALSPAQSRLRIYQGETPVGWVTISQRLTADSGKTVELRMQTGTAPYLVRTHRQTTYDRDGRLTKIFIEQLTGQARRQIITTFDSIGATVITADASSRTVQKFPWPPGAVLTRPSEFWFLREPPKLGASCEFTDFDPVTLTFKPVRVTYAGQEVVVVVRQNKTLAKIITKQGDSETPAWVDETGLPVRVGDRSGMHLER